MANSLLVPGIEQALHQFTYEIAGEFGISLEGETSSKQNGFVGGEVTKRLVQMAQSHLNGIK